MYCVKCVTPVREHARALYTPRLVRCRFVSRLRARHLFHEPSTSPIKPEFDAGPLQHETSQSGLVAELFVVLLACHRLVRLPRSTFLIAAKLRTFRALSDDAAECRVWYGTTRIFKVRQA